MMKREKLKGKEEKTENEERKKKRERLEPKSLAELEKSKKLKRIFKKESQQKAKGGGIRGESINRRLKHRALQYALA